MLNFYRQLFSWLLILIMTISPVQIAMAIDFDQPGQASTCQSSQEQLRDLLDIISTGSACTSDQSSNCVDLSVCVAEYNFTSFRSTGLFVLKIQAIKKLKFVADNDAVSTYYPELLRRPPKA